MTSARRPGGLSMCKVANRVDSHGERGKVRGARRSHLGKCSLPPSVRIGSLRTPARHAIGDSRGTTRAQDLLGELAMRAHGSVAQAGARALLPGTIDREPIDL